MKRNGLFYCDFCGQSQDQAAQIVTGPFPVAICDECTDLAKEIVDETRAKKTDSSAAIPKVLHTDTPSSETT